MRLIKQPDGTWVTQFTVVWEVEYLARVGEQWIPFALPHTTEPVGEIYAPDYTIRLYQGVTLSTRQVVILIPSIDTSPSIDDSTE